MKRPIILGCMISIFIFSAMLYAQDEEFYIVGEIRELVRSDNMIQVGERNYEVELVMVDFGIGDVPVMGGMSDLEEKSLVKVYVKEKGENFWIAEKVIVIKGDKRGEVLKEMD